MNYKTPKQLAEIADHRAIRELADPVAEHHVAEERRTIARWNGDFVVVVGDTVAERFDVANTDRLASAVEDFLYDDGHRVLDAAIAVFDREAWQEVLHVAREAA